MLDRLEFLLIEAFTALRRNSWMTFASITTSAVALMLIGGMALAYVGVARLAESLPERLEISMFLRDGTDEPTRNAVAKRIEQLAGVAAVRFVSKDEGLRRFQAENPGISVQDLGAGNPLPDQFVVRAKRIDDVRGIAAKLEGMPEAEPNGVRYLSEVQNFLEDVSRLVRWLGLVLGGAMLLTGGILIYNTIRMTVVARSREIRIMSLVGATRATIIAPMLIEGMVQGLLGGLLAGLALGSLYNLVGAVLASMSALGELPDYPWMGMTLGLGAAGVVYGLVCSSFAVREARGVR